MTLNQMFSVVDGLRLSRLKNGVFFMHGEQVDIAAGGWHSVALTADGEVNTSYLLAHNILCFLRVKVYMGVRSKSLRLGHITYLLYRSILKYDRRLRFINLVGNPSFWLCICPLFSAWSLQRHRVNCSEMMGAGIWMGQRRAWETWIW